MNNHKKMCRDLYLYYSENGICVKCGQAFSLAGHVLCGDCTKKANMAQKKYDPDGSKKRTRMKALREQRKAEGICAVCGKNPVEPPHVSCPKCLEIGRERELLKRIRKKIKKGLV